MTYHKRMDAVWVKMRDTRTIPKEERGAAVRFNRNLMRNSREGDYVIQVKDGYWDQLETNRYISCDYMRGSMSFGTRAQAACFKKEEIKEVLSRIGPRFKVTKITNADRRKKYGW